MRVNPRFLNKHSHTLIHETRKPAILKKMRQSAFLKITFSHYTHEMRESVIVKKCVKAHV